MEESASGITAKQMAGYSTSGMFPALVLLLTIPLATFISESFPVNGLPELASRSNALSFGGQDLIWAQLAAAVAMVFIFYEIGKRIDFASHYRMLIALAFAGAIIGNLPGFYLYTTNWLGGYSWQFGFGYVQSFGLPEPSSAIDLLISAIGAFMIPVAGLALAYFRFQRVDTTPDSQTDSTATGSRYSLRFSSVAFAVALLAYPIADVVNRILFAKLPLPSQSLNIVGQFPGYAGFLIYPVTFLIIFYFMGRKLAGSSDGLMKFGLAVFIGAVIGLFLSLFLGAYIANPSAMVNLISRINAYDTLTFLVTDGIFVTILGFAACSLGFITAQKKEEANLRLAA
jgi:hypothetical protein